MQTRSDPTQNKQETNKGQPLNDKLLTEEILKKEAELRTLEKETIRNQREMKHIENSQTWKYFGWLHTIFYQFYKWTGRKRTWNKKAYIHELESELTELREQLLEKREQLRSLYLERQTLNSYQIIDFVKGIREQGELIDFLNQIITDKKAHEENYNQALRYTARLFMDEETGRKHHLYNNILAALKIEDIPEFMLREGLIEESPLPLTAVSSFRANLSIRLREKQLLGDLPEFILEDKLDSYHFIDSLAIRRPEIIAQRFSHDQLPKQDKVVLKPLDEAGARGVYLIHSFHDIIDIHRAKKHEQWQALEQSIQEDLETGRVMKDEWFMEELIVEDENSNIPARDLKFYSFYGRVGLILEISRYPERKHCWWTATGERVRTGKYEEDLFRGIGVTAEEIKLVEDISAKIPAPFIRIDFLRTENELVFGEFTAKPGNYDEFDQLTDQRLGDLYIEARGRLMNDLWQGKSFAEFHRFKEALGYDVRS